MGRVQGMLDMNRIEQLCSIRGPLGNFQEGRGQSPQGGPKLWPYTCAYVLMTSAVGVTHAYRIDGKLEVHV